MNPDKDRAQAEAMAQEARRRRRLELLVAITPLVLVGVGAGLVYLPAGLLLPGLLAWWDLRAPAPPAAPPTVRGGDR